MSALDPRYLSPAVHDAAQVRQGGADLLGLALMDARTRTLGWLAAVDGLVFRGELDDLDPPHWLIGHVAWFQEFSIARHLQRARGAGTGRGRPRLGSVDPGADGWFDPAAMTRSARWQAALPDGEQLRQYLQATLDTTLELLEKAGDTPQALEVFHQALHHEDRAAETLATLLQTLELPAERLAQAEAAGWVRPWRALVRRDPIGLVGGREVLGPLPGPWAPEPERGQASVQVPEFEIDAQPVSWAQFAEFVDDQGYDDRRLWSDAGWDWLESTGRRAPRHVAQFNGGVLARRMGRLQRLPGSQPALHVTAHEADAWCRWAGRRLPSEAEWQHAARTARGRGFVWGEVLEWVAGSARALPEGAPPPAEAGRVLRGATLQGSPRLAYVQARRYAMATSDAGFTGFRSCAV